jgi:hypothetical protein
MDALTVRRFLADPDSPGSLADRTRTQRRTRLLDTFPEIASMTVLDIGGTAGFWTHLRLAPADLTILNIVEAGGPGMRMIVGDACDPPAEVFDRAYDLVVCNSVIDQVGGLERRKQLAAVIRGAAPRYWVQTANRGFPLDAYFMFPWFSRLPESTRALIVRHWPLTHMHTSDRAEALHRVRMVELQSRRDLADLFPGSRLIVERFWGLPKSLIAVG